MDRYRAFLRDCIEPDLERVVRAQARLAKKAQAYERLADELGAVLSALARADLAGGSPGLYLPSLDEPCMHVPVSEVKEMRVDVGMGVFVEMEVHEALRFSHEMAYHCRRMAACQSDRECEILANRDIFKILLESA